MRNVLRRLTFGVAGAGMVVAMAAGPMTSVASASVAAPQHTAVTAGGGSYLQWPTVKYGDHGIRVRTVQYLLNAWGYHVTVTGKFGLATKFAVKDFQKHCHLYPDGVVGQQTWPHLVITVRLGSHGYAVVAVQDQLRNAYRYHFVKINGRFGKKTWIAVKLFQKSFRIQSDGIVGLGTWNTLVKFDPKWA
jgi:peptidoglycan hydrolase-like protein with peptidoglycan-binding domain